MRFRKSFKLFPGVRINFSGSGVSTSIGPKGATVNIKPGRSPRATVGIPGTGISHTEAIGASDAEEKDASASPGIVAAILVALLVLYIAAKGF